MIQRSGVITFNGHPLTLIGKEIKVGEKIPDFMVLANNLEPLEFRNTYGKVRIISSIPSIDTPVCDAQTRRFNKEAAKLPGVEIFTISMDLPFAQTRWCGAAKVDKVKTYSDHRDASFGITFGTLIKEMRLNTRAIFVIDKDEIVQHVEYVKELTEHPNYEAAVTAVKQLIK